jgi:DNA-binding response OmpR family regulator
MPDVSGELLREIKREKPFEDLQVIMQTVMDSSQNIQAIEAESSSLVKPVRKELLSSTIRAALRDYQRRKLL